MLNVIDEITHECLATRIDRRLKAINVIDVLLVKKGTSAPDSRRQIITSNEYQIGSCVPLQSSVSIGGC